jgi:hypothetical protein
MATSSDGWDDTWWTVAACSLVILLLSAGMIGVVWLFLAALDVAAASMMANLFAPEAALCEIVLFALWTALRPLRPLFPLFGIPTDFPFDAH